MWNFREASCRHGLGPDWGVWSLALLLFKVRLGEGEGMSFPSQTLWELLEVQGYLPVILGSFLFITPT